MGVALFIAAGVGAATSPGASWPLLAAVAAVILVAVLAFLTLTLPDPGSAVFIESAAALMGIFLIVVIRKG